LFVPPAQFNWITGEEYVGRYEVSDAKYFATQFCRQCGSSLPWLVQGGSNVIVPVGTLDESPNIEPQGNIFWNSHASWFKDVCELDKHDAFPTKKTK